jgi:integrase
MIRTGTSKRTGKRWYDVCLRDPNGKEYSRRFATKKAAEAHEAAEKTARGLGTWTDPRLAATPFAVVAEKWLAADGTKQRSSRARDRSILDRHLLPPPLGTSAIGSVTRADVQLLVKGWAKTHQPSTVGRMYSTMRAVFSYAVASDYIAKSPCRRDIPLPRVDLVERPELDADQLEELAEKLGPDQAVMMWIGVVLGLRWGECAALTVGAVDTLAGRLAVKAQLDRVDGVSRVKTRAGRRTMSVAGWLVDELAALMARRGLTGADPEALLFVSAQGTPLRYTNWRRRVWLPAVKAAAVEAPGLAGLVFHDLRSLATTALIDEGVDPKTAQTRLGHSSPQVTLGIYARATRRADKAAADKVGERFRPRGKRGVVRPARFSPPAK